MNPTRLAFANSPLCAKLLNLIDYLNVPIDKDSFAHLLSFVDAPLSLKHLFFILQEFPSIAKHVINATNGPRWRWIHRLISSPVATCHIFLDHQEIIALRLTDDDIFALTKEPLTLRNSSLSRVSKLSPLFSLLGHRPMAQTNQDTYHQLQAHALIAYLTFQKEEKGGTCIPAHNKLMIEGMLAVRNLALSEHQDDLTVLQTRTLTPEKFLLKISRIPKTIRADHFKPFELFLEQAISFNRGQHKRIGRPEAQQIPAADNQVTDFFSDLNVGLKEEENSHRLLNSPPLGQGYVKQAYDILSPPEKITHENSPQTRHNLIQASKAIAKENQLLSFAWSELSQFDTNSLIQEITTTQSENIEDILANAYLHLMLWAAMNSKAISNLSVNSNSNKECTYLPRSGILRLITKGPKLSKSSIAYESEHRILKQNHIDLHLPDCARRSINRGLSIDSRLFMVASQRINNLCQKRISTIKRKLGAKRLTLSRIKNLHFRRLSRMPKCDISTAALTLNKYDFLARTKIHYASFDSDFLGESFRESCCQILQSTNEKLDFVPADPFQMTLNIGTPFRLTPNIIIATVRKLQSEIEAFRDKILTPQGLIDFHNAYSTYTALFVCYATGHRRAKTPFIHSNEWDSRSQFGCIRDKDTADYQHSRLIWIPNNCAQQLTNYLDHIHNIYLTLGIKRSKSQQIPQGHPEFFFIDGKRADIGYKVLSKILAGFGYDFEGHPQRHYLKSELQERFCDPELLEAFLGHWHTGQECWVKTSSLHPADFKNELNEHLSPLLRQLGFKPIKGLESSTGGPLNLAFPHPSRPQCKIATKGQLEIQLSKRPGKFWFTLFRKRQQMAGDWTSVFRTEQLQVLTELERYLPDLYAGKKKCSVSDQQLTTLIHNLTPAGLHPEKKHRRLFFLDFALHRGTKSLEWKTPFPQVPRVIATERNRVRPSALKRLRKFRELEAAFLNDLENPFPEDEKCRVGQIALSGILFGGLLHEKWIDLLLPALDGNKIFQHADWMWLDLGVRCNGEEKETDKTRFKRQCRPESFRRWFPDPLTQLLIYRWVEQPKSQVKDSIESTWEAVATYLESLDVERPQTLKGLLFIARPYHTLTIPSFLCAYAENSLLSSSLPDQIFIRSFTGKIVPTPFKRKPLHEEIAIKPLKGYSDKQQSQLFEQLKSVFEKENLSKAKNKKKAAKDGIERFLKNNSGALSPILQLLAHWSNQLLSDQISEKERRQQTESFAVSSVQTYIEMIGGKLLEVARDQDPLDFGITEYIAFYERLGREFNENPGMMNNSPSPESDSQTKIGRLNQFHGFLEYFYEQPELNVFSIVTKEGEGRSQASSISVNLVTEQQYKKILERLGWGKINLTRTETMTLVATILAYRTGLRKSELHGLTLADLPLSEIMELIVFPNDYRGLKSRSAIRRPPLQYLIPDREELKFINNWVSRRSRESQTGNLNAPLFTASQISEKLISESDLLGTARQIIKLELQDQSVVWHHWRDSFLHTYYLRLLLRDDIPMDFIPHFLEGECYAPDARKQLRDQLFPNDRSGRKTLFGAATLIGHADIEEGFLSYFHLTDWLLGYHLRHPDHLPKLSDKAFMALTGLKESRTDQLQKTNSPLCLAISAKCQKFEDQLQHSLMGKVSSLRRKQGRKAKEKGLPEFDVAFAEARKIFESQMTLKTEDELAAIRSFYGKIQLLSIPKQNKYQISCRYLLDSYIYHGHYLQFEDPDKTNNLKRMLKNIGIQLEFGKATYHPSRYRKGRKNKKRWDNKLGKTLTQGSACQIKDKRDCIRLREDGLDNGTEKAKVEILNILINLSKILSSVSQ